jgi:hypothetical protein
MYDATVQLLPPSTGPESTGVVRKQPNEEWSVRLYGIRCRPRSESIYVRKRPWQFPKPLLIEIVPCACEFLQISQISDTQRNIPLAPATSASHISRSIEVENPFFFANRLASFFTKC